LNIVPSWIKASRPSIAFVCVLASLTQSAPASGVSAYLPLNLEPEMERQIERVLILADEPILKRPFAGVARYNLATPAYSIYFGTGAQWRNILPKWDLGVDFRLAQNVARDHVLPSDPQGARPDSFYKIYTGLLYLSRRF
jgi:hypothetical protein